jgi:hypothetical protein
MTTIKAITQTIGKQKEGSREREQKIKPSFKNPKKITVDTPTHKEMRRNTAEKVRQNFGYLSYYDLQTANTIEKCINGIIYICDSISLYDSSGEIHPSCIQTDSPCGVNLWKTMSLYFTAHSVRGVPIDVAGAHEISKMAPVDDPQVRRSMSKEKHFKRNM